MVRQIEGRVIGVSKGGFGVCREQGKVYFVEGAIVGELVLFEVIEDRKRYGRGRLVEVKEASCSRVEVDCEGYFRGCGGCDFRHVCFEDSLCMKAEGIWGELKKLSGLESLESYSCFGLDSRDSSRQRMKLHYEAEALGLYARGSHRIVSVDGCRVFDPKLLSVYRYFSKLFGKEKCMEGFRGELLLELDFEGKVYGRFDRSFGVEARKGVGRGKSGRVGVLDGKSEKLEQVFISFLKGLVDDAILGGVRYGDWVYGQSWVCECYYFGANGKEHVVWHRIGEFMQGSWRGNCLLLERLDKMLEDVQISLGGDLGRVLDLYSGGGNLSFIAGRRSKEVISVESSVGAGEAHQMGVASNADHLMDVKGMHFVVCDLREGVFVEEESFGCVIVDPPRVGLSEAVIGWLGEVSCNYLVYVSCESGSLARDLGRLSGKWKVERFEMLDMYDGMSQVECLVLLRRFL